MNWAEVAQVLVGVCDRLIARSDSAFLAPWVKEIGALARAMETVLEYCHTRLDNIHRLSDEPLHFEMIAWLAARELWPAMTEVERRSVSDAGYHPGNITEKVECPECDGSGETGGRLDTENWDADSACDPLRNCPVCAGTGDGQGCATTRRWLFAFEDDDRETRYLDAEGKGRKGEFFIGTMDEAHREAERRADLADIEWTARVTCESHGKVLP